MVFADCAIRCLPVSSCSPAACGRKSPARGQEREAEAAGDKSGVPCGVCTGAGGKTITLGFRLICLAAYRRRLVSTPGPDTAPANSLRNKGNRGRFIIAGAGRCDRLVRRCDRDDASAAPGGDGTDDSRTNVSTSRAPPRYAARFAARPTRTPWWERWDDSPARQSTATGSAMVLRRNARRAPPERRCWSFRDRVSNGLIGVKGPTNGNPTSQWSLGSGLKFGISS